MKELKISRLQNAEHLALMNDLYLLLSEADIDVLKPLKEELKKGILKSEAGQNNVRKNENTDTLVSIDRKRKDLYRGIVFRIKSERLSLEEDVRKSAEKVNLLVKTYGNFTTHNYQKETIEIQNFVTELKSAEYLSSVEAIGILKWVAWLEETNETFKKLYTERRDDYAGQISYDMKAIRKELDETFRKITETINALRILHPSEVLNILISKLNASINHWQNIMAVRNGKQKGKNQEAEKPSN